MDQPLQQAAAHNGLGDPRPSRYAFIHLGHLAWLVVGAWLYLRSIWPSTCVPGDLIELYTCSSRLPESGRLSEGLLLTWLWATPLLVGLAAGRRLTHRPEKEAPP